MERSDLLVALSFVVPLGAQVVALWLGVRLRPRFGWLGQALACLVPPLAALALLAAMLQLSAPCPPGAELQCGEGTFSLICVGIACTGANLLFAIPIQLGVRAHLRQRASRPPH